MEVVGTTVEVVVEIGMGAQLAGELRGMVLAIVCLEVWGIGS